MRRFFVPAVLLALCLACLFSSSVLAQGVDTALLRGTVTDSSGAVIPGVTVTMKNVATGVEEKRTTDEAGRFVFTDLKPAPYTATAEAQGFKKLIRENIVLRVGQQSDLDLQLEVGEISQQVEVTAESPLLNTVSGALGTEVTNKYITAMPLIDRDISTLSFLAPGVTEVSNAGIGSQGGTVFASNGQRFATAEFRLDGALLSNPEGGEGGSSNVQYKPSVEAIQEFKLQNNSFSAEYGNNGGTVVSIVTKSGTNQFHGSGWWFFRRPSLDANDFFSNAAGQPIGPYAHDQYGGSVGGPIKKNKSFFFFDYERQRNNGPFTIITSVPTDLQRNGDFSQTFNPDGTVEQIFDPRNTVCTGAGSSLDCERAPFAGNKIPLAQQDPVGANLIKLYPSPTDAGDPVTGLNNYTQKLVENSPSYQLDARIDHNFSDNHRIDGRYSRSHYRDFRPDPFLAPNLSQGTTNDVTIQDHWTIKPTMLWTNRITFHRGYFPQDVQPTVDPLSVGFPEILINNPWFRQPAFPDINVDGYQGLVTNACCTTTRESDTQWSFNSVMNKIMGSHNLKFGGEKRIFLNNFFQPDDTGGEFSFNGNITQQSIFNPDSSQGNSLASLLLGWADSGSVVARPHVANKSGEAAFFIQDDWRITSRLTLNLGLRYEWSTPYSERYNHNQFTCFTCDSGINVPGVGELIGTTILASSSRRHADPDYNNIAPRLGFAYRLDNKTVVRGGAGIYYGMNFATNWQYGGTGWNKGVQVIFSKDGGISQYATLENPFPVGFVGPQQGKYGALTLYGYNNHNHGSNTFRNAEIYQWNLGVEREIPGNVLVELNYSANRSTHLPWNYSTENRNYISAANRLAYGTAGLASHVPNPFQFLFQQLPGQPAPIFNLADSIYNDPTIPQIDLLRPYPQFPGTFAGFPEFVATSSYQSMQVRFEKRLSHGLSVTGSYTFSKFIDDSDSGGNAWIGNIGFAGAPQDLTNLRAEKSVSANDTPQRLAFAAIYELPVGRGRTLGRDMNRVMNGIIGGWQVNTFVTFQTGQPLVFSDSNQTLADSPNQRPNINGKACSGANVYDVVNGTANYFNLDSFSHPADQTPGNMGRYISDCRAPGIHNIDLGISKKVEFTESRYLEIRGDFFNAFNTPRFGFPNTTFGGDGFGVINGQYNSPRHGQIGFRFVF
ncbi:MAG TPA: TonB-dependent receptor [Bryobacteraceae bacterium]|nr:TonB-dependent receptor [Bryobacteraceae bacterium]